MKRVTAELNYHVNGLGFVRLPVPGWVRSDEDGLFIHRPHKPYVPIHARRKDGLADKRKVSAITLERIEMPGTKWLVSQRSSGRWMTGLPLQTLDEAREMVGYLDLAARRRRFSWATAEFGHDTLDQSDPMTKKGMSAKRAALAMFKDARKEQAS